MEVALIGKGAGKKSAPLKGSGVTTWGVNDVVAHRECDVCFWMDKHLMEDTQMDKLIKSSVNKTATKTYCVEHYDDIPTSVPYPISEVQEFFGTDYFSDSCCFMVALAAYQRFSKISLYGFNYAWGDNYGKEKPAVSFWLGVCVGMGIQVEVFGDHSELLLTPDNKVYSYLTDQRERGVVQIKRQKQVFDSVSFSIKDRIELIGLLPKSGNYMAVKFSKWLRENLFFTPEESKAINLRRIDNDINSPWVWDDNELEGKVIKLSAPEQSYLSSILNKLDADGLITYDNIELYEKFCVPGRS
jgi:hypothetical protein